MINSLENKKVIEFLYNESSTEQINEFKNELLINNKKYEEVVEAKSILSEIDKINYSPSDKTVKNIMDYAVS